MKGGFYISIIVGALLLIGVSWSVGPSVGFAQATPTPASSDVAAHRAALQAQLDSLNSQIADTQSTLNNLHGQHSSLQRDISILDADIKKSKLLVQATKLQLQALSQNISLHTSAISQLSGHINQEKQSLAQVIRETRQMDDYTLVDFVLSSQNISSFFSDLDTFSALKSAIHDSSNQLSTAKDTTQKERDQLTTQSLQKQQLAQLEIQQENDIVTEQAQKQALLSQTKSKEATYQSIYNTQQKTAAQIRAELFALAGGGGAIQLPTAIADAKIASGITGVRPALILAILSQESDLGKNTGQCLVTDLSTGDGKGKNTGTPFSGVMKAPRDTVVFKELMDALGRDWTTTAVSCPQPGGYGGAMGPTQFIPSTWKLYQGRIESALGVSATDPWNALHAIVATGLLMEDNGAAAGTDAAEREAAGKYFAGGGWASAGLAYSSSVMRRAAQFQSDINTLSGN